MSVKVMGQPQTRGKKLSGHYQVTGSNLIREGCHLVIGTRKPTATKPKNFLLEHPGNGEKDRYISNLYPVPKAPGSPQGALWFDLDYQGRYYTLEINQATREAEIKEKQRKNRGKAMAGGWQAA